MSQPATAIAPPAPAPVRISELAPKPSERGLLIGTTGSGKSTLANEFIEAWRAMPRVRIIILDSKPCYRAQWQLNGLPAAPLYRRWDYDKTFYIPGSVVIPAIDPKRELQLAWSLGYRIVIAQIPHKKFILRLDACIEAAWELRTKKRPIMFYVDELNNYFRGKRAGDGITLVLTAGRQLGIGMLGGAQRPVWISREAMTELTVLYWYETGFSEDIKHLRNMGLPPDAHPPMDAAGNPVPHAFLYWNRLTKQSGYYRLQKG